MLSSDGRHVDLRQSFFEDEFIGEEGGSFPNADSFPFVIDGVLV